VPWLQPSASDPSARRALWTALVAASALCLLGPGRAAALPELRPGQPQRARAQPGQRLTYRVALAQRDCAFGKLASDTEGLELRVVGDRARYSRRLVRRQGPVGSAGPTRAFGFCVEPAGEYRLEVSAHKAAQAPIPFELTLQSILGRATKVQPIAAASEVVSPRLRKLQASLHGTRSDAQIAAITDRFWREIDRAGTPLIEALNTDEMLVTFLYRARPPLRSVSISWPMWSGPFAHNELEPLAGSDVLWRSVVVPKATRFSYQLVIDPPLDPSPNQGMSERAQQAVTRADPRNRRVLPESPEFDAFELRSVVALPDAPAEPPLHPRPRPARGRLSYDSLRSAELEVDHTLTIYTPAQRGRTAPYPALIVFDGETYLEQIELPLLLDVLIARKEIAPLVAVFVHNYSPNSRDRELPCNADFAAFVAHELLPHVQERYPIAREAKRTGLLGSSFGALASSYIALSYPEQFGKVLSQSGSYWWSFPRGHAAFDGDDQPGWLRRRVQNTPRVPVEFYLSAGRFETDAPGGGVLGQTRLQRDALRAQGYTVSYQEFVGGHDVLAWRATLADALRAMFPPGT